MPHPLTLATLSLLLSATFLPAQTPLAFDQIHSQPELEATIRSLDTALFAAYNACTEPDQFERCRPLPAQLAFGWT